MLHIEVCKQSDYDKVLQFLKENHVKIETRSPEELYVVADMSHELSHKMQSSVEFNGLILVEDSSFVGRK